MSKFFAQHDVLRTTPGKSGIKSSDGTGLDYLPISMIDRRYDMYTKKNTLLRTPCSVLASDRKGTESNFLLP